MTSGDNIMNFIFKLVGLVNGSCKIYFCNLFAIIPMLFSHVRFSLMWYKAFVAQLVFKHLYIYYCNSYNEMACHTIHMNHFKKAQPNISLLALHFNFLPLPSSHPAHLFGPALLFFRGNFPSCTFIRACTIIFFGHFAHLHFYQGLHV